MRSCLVTRETKHPLRVSTVRSDSLESQLSYRKSETHLSHRTTQIYVCRSRLPHWICVSLTSYTIILQSCPLYGRHKCVSPYLSWIRLYFWTSFVVFSCVLALSCLFLHLFQTKTSSGNFIYLLFFVSQTEKKGPILTSGEGGT